MSKRKRKRKNRDNRIVPANIYVAKISHKPMDRAKRTDVEKDRLAKLIAERDERLRREARMDFDAMMKRFDRNLAQLPPKPTVRVQAQSSAASRVDRRLYFAYGSNLSLSQMRRRCPGSTALYSHHLPSFKLEFQRFANIVEATEEDCVPGAIYLITPEDEKALDRYEGVHRQSYIKRTFKFFTPKRNWRDVLYYQKLPGRLIPPSREYLGRILAGYKSWQLDTGELDAALTMAENADYEHAQRKLAEKAANPVPYETVDDVQNALDNVRDTVIDADVPAMSVAELKDMLADPTWGWSDEDIEAITREIERKERKE